MEKKKKFKKRKVIIPVVVILVLLDIIMNLFFGSTEVTSIVYDGEQVQKYEMHDLSSTINVSGKIESQNVSDVTTELTTKVKQLNVALGDHVNEGDVLLVFDDSEIREQISELESQISDGDRLIAKEIEIAERDLAYTKNESTRRINAANDVVTRAQTAYDNAVSTYNKASEPDEKAVAKQIMDEALNSLNIAKAEYEEIKAATDQANQSAQDAVDLKNMSNTSNSEVTKQLSRLYRQLDEVTVKAGQSGIITVLNIAQGGIPNGVLMRIEDNTKLKVKVNINEKDITKISEGLETTIKSDALEGEQYEGTISKVINFASAISQSTLISEAETGYSAEVLVEEGSKFLLGMSAKVEIKLNSTGEKLSVAYDSIAGDDSPYVYKAEPSGNKYKVTKVSVTIGEQNDYFTEISSPDLKEGDLIFSYPDTVTEGDVVEIHASDN